MRKLSLCSGMFVKLLLYEVVLIMASERSMPHFRCAKIEKETGIFQMSIQLAGFSDA